MNYFPVNVFKLELLNNLFFGDNFTYEMVELVFLRNFLDHVSALIVGVATHVLNVVLSAQQIEPHW